jgi:pimeloyl-ACP methyl ester carboxylesterase
MPATAPVTATFDHITLPSGIRLHYAEQGAGDAPAIVLLHGLSDSWFSFSRLMTWLPESVRAIALTQRGHGESDKPDDGFAMEDFAADVVGLLDTLAIRDAIIVGHSMGSFVARRVAERHPARVRHLVVIGTGPVARNAATDQLWADVQKLTDPVDLGFIRDFQMSTVSRPVPQEFMERVVIESTRMPARVWKRALAGMRDYALPASPLRVPTLVLGGVQDAVFSLAEQQAIIDAIPGATLSISDGIGHTPHWEEPDVVAGHLMRLA